MATGSWIELAKDRPHIALVGASALVAAAVIAALRIAGSPVVVVGWWAACFAILVLAGLALMYIQRIFGSGVPNIYVNRSRYSDIRPDLFRRSETIRLHSIYADVSSELHSLIMEALEQGKKIELLIADVDSEFVDGGDNLQLAIISKDTRRKIEADFKALAEIEERRCSSGWPGRLEVRTYRRQPMWCIYMFDDRELYAAPYLYRVEGGDTICVYARKRGYAKSAFDQFKLHCDRLWLESKPVTLDRCGV